MESTAPEIHRVVRRAGAVLIVQLAATIAAILLAQVAASVRVRVSLVLLVALLNAATVVVVTMGVRRDSRLVAYLLVAVLIFVVSLLGWPAWDVYERVRVF